jgi:hypothetical protein
MMRDNRSVTTTTKTRKVDAALGAAVDVALTALAEEAGVGEFGEHLGAVAEDDRVVTHYFAATHPGYAGWRWAVTIARAPRQKAVTVNEVVLIPGDSAVTAPTWVPWKDRIAKGDLGPGDLVPIDENDVRLVPGYLVGDPPFDPHDARELREVVRETGLGREWVLSIEGRDGAAQRWLAGDNGPDTPIAQAAPGHCGTCGFLVRLSGPLTLEFGACANVSSPSDGQVVAFGHGCGAHSDVRPEPSQHQVIGLLPVHDTYTPDVWGEDDVEIVPT